MAHRLLTDHDLSDEHPSQAIFYHVLTARVLVLKKGVPRLANQRRTFFLHLLHNKNHLVESGQQPSQLVVMTFTNNLPGSLVDLYQSSALQRLISLTGRILHLHLRLNTIDKVPWTVRRPS